MLPKIHFPAAARGAAFWHELLDLDALEKGAFNLEHFSDTRLSFVVCFLVSSSTRLLSCEARIFCLRWENFSTL